MPSFFKLIYTLALEWTTFTPSGVNLFSSGNYVEQVQQVLGFDSTSQSPVVPVTEPGQAGGLVSFHPDGASPGFECQYPGLSPFEWEPCNWASSRDCWMRQTTGDQIYDINTDFENIAYTPPGRAREYWLNASVTEVSADGFSRQGNTYNATYPGPKIEACWGDQVIVHVTNDLPNMGTTVHWHGVRQLGTNEMDGVPVTQCPIPRGSTFTYNFTATQYGHSWYHSHYSLQYADGLAGPLVIYGPSSANWDLAPQPMLISDWVDDNAIDRYVQEQAGNATKADSIVFNGVGRQPGASTPADITGYNITTFEPGKRHLLRLINGAAGTQFVISIDAHNMTIVAADFIPVEPYTVKSLVLGIGQRYDVIVEGLEDPLSLSAGNYWIRTHPADGCNTFTAGTFSSTGSPSEPFDVRSAVIHYDVANTTNKLPTDLPSEPCSLQCVDVDSKNLRPIVPWTISPVSLNDVAASTFYTAHQLINDTTLGQAGNYLHWLLSLDPKEEKATHQERNSTFWIDFNKPTLLNLSRAHLDPHYNILNYTFDDPNASKEFIVMVIDGSLLPGVDKTKFQDVTNTNVPAVTHPIHWHGNDVAILGQSTEQYVPNESWRTWSLDNPTRRDVILVPAGGYVALAFKPDNPGVWLVHCHIAWHASAGLALQMVVQQNLIEASVGLPALEAGRDNCLAWEKDFHNTTEPRIQRKVDSGI